MSQFLQGETQVVEEGRGHAFACRAIEFDCTLIFAERFFVKIVLEAHEG